jgi:Cytochrome b5-like Heme/Steroid binding domain/Eukaryotic cytochrome b561
MLSSQFVICHAKDNGTIALHEHLQTSQYMAPTHQEGPEVLNRIVGNHNTTYMGCVFERIASPKNGIHVDMDVLNDMPLLWAFQPNSQLNYRGEWFSHHEVNQRGSLRINFASGSSTTAPVVSYNGKVVHGYGMIFVWLLVFPFGAFYARHFRSLSGWLVVKTSVQSIGVIGAFVFFFWIMFIEIRCDFAHGILGLIMLSLVAVQVFLGIMSLVGLSNETLDKSRSFTRNIHRLVGLALLLASMIQIPLGINILHPWVDPKHYQLWGIYLTLSVFWILAFVSAEVYYYVKCGRSELPKMARIDKILDEATGKSSRKDTSKFMKTFTWQSLDEAVLAGGKYVVADGRYVYDISQWITSHPGGRIILHSVCGTDITNDYFHESGFDAAEFRAKPEAPPQLPRGSFTPNRFSSDLRSVMSMQSMSSNLETTQFTQHDWQCVVKARRTHGNLF